MYFHDTDTEETFKRGGLESINMGHMGMLVLLIMSEKREQLQLGLKL